MKLMGYVVKYLGDENQVKTLFIEGDSLAVVNSKGGVRYIARRGNADGFLGHVDAMEFGFRKNPPEKIEGQTVAAA